MVETTQNDSELLEQFKTSGAAGIVEELGLSFIEDADQIVLIEDAEQLPLDDEVRAELQGKLKEVSGVDVTFGLL